MDTKIILLLITAVLIISGCTSQTTTQPNTPGSNDTTTGPQGNTLPPVATVGPVKEFYMTAKQFEFRPSTITVNRGDQVVLRITSTDVEHGFSLATYDIIETLPVNQTKTIKFTATEAGEFNFFCSVLCGSGHGDMRGKLIVNP